MTDAAAKTKFGGKNTQGYRVWQDAVTAFAAAKTEAGKWNLINDNGAVLSVSAINELDEDEDTYEDITASQGFKDAKAAAKKSFPPAVLERANAIHNADKTFEKDQDKLRSMAQKIEDAKGRFTGTAKAEKQKSIYSLLKTYNSTPEALRPDTGWGQLIAAGVDPQAYINKGIQMVRRFRNTDNYRKELKAAGYTARDFYDVGIFDNLYNGENFDENSDWKSNQMFIGRVRPDKSQGI